MAFTNKLKNIKQQRDDNIAMVFLRRVQQCERSRVLFVLVPIFIRTVQRAPESAGIIELSTGLEIISLCIWPK